MYILKLIVLTLYLRFIFCLNLEPKKFQTVAGSGTFFVVSDLHYDPYYSPYAKPDDFCRETGNPQPQKRITNLKNGVPTYGQYGCDAPFELLLSAFNSMKQLNPNPDFILIPGDSSGHKMSEWSATVAAIKNVTETLSKFFPGVPILPVVGNNDCFPDFGLPLGPTSILKAEFDVWSQIGVPLDQQSNFVNGGFYAVKPVPGLKIIALNTVFYNKDWCDDNTTECTSLYLRDSEEDKLHHYNSVRMRRVFKKESDPNGQFNWLQAQLAESRGNGEKVYIMGHIPPGASKGFGHALWKKSYVAELQNLLNLYGDIVPMHFFSHLHRDSFRMIHDSTGKNLLGSILMTSSISPYSLNNPSYRLVSYDRNTFELKDSTVYYTALDTTSESSPPIWYPLYSFQSTYGVPLTTKGLDQLVDIIESNDKLLSIFIKYRTQLSDQDLPEYPKHYYRCGFTEIISDDLDDCLKKK